MSVTNISTAPSAPAPEADVTDGLKPTRAPRKATTRKAAPRKAAPRKAAPKGTRSESQLLAKLATLQDEIRKLEGLKAERKALLVEARNMVNPVSYTKLAEAMQVQTGAVHGIVKAATEGPRQR